MVICLCKGVSDSKIRWLVQNGATCVKDVMATCRAGSDCGSCVTQVRELVEAVKAEAQKDGCELETASNE